MIENILQIIAPHYCCGCKKIGSPLCSSCIYNITDEQNNTCINCGKLARDGACSECRQIVAYQKGWCAGTRDEALKELINSYKFSYVKAAHKPLASLLDQTMPILPSGTIVVPIPTIGKHIRQRGYDHAHLLAKTVARQRRFHCLALLRRKNNTVQREAIGAKEREIQAKEAFKCPQKLEASTPYLIVDDVITTGATIRAAAKCLQQSGAKKIFIAAAARQPLDLGQDL